MTRTRRSRISLLAASLALIATSLASAQGIEAPRVPLRTAIKEINTLRAEYTDGYNKKDVAGLTAMYLPDAVVVQGDGTTLVGRAAIGQSLAEQAPKWGQASISSDTMRVFGNTAWDVGTMETEGPDSAKSTSHYLVVLRRGVQAWRISSVAIVPATHVAAAK
jgi:ketosteroid isomerase-like protein